jgi:NADP-dependent 3-hydroxy acid dehydrogenase YdfG
MFNMRMLISYFQLIDKSESVHEVAEELRKEFNGQKFLSISSAVGTKANAEQTVEQVFNHFGSLDILVNNAGIYSNFKSNISQHII